MRRLLITLLLFAGCSPGAPDALTVYAASSLTDAFTEIGERFEQQTGRPVVFNFAGSQTLRLQIEHGAPADVFATADMSHLEALEASGRVSNAQHLVYTDVVAVVPEASDARQFADLADVERVIVGAHTVPVGMYTRELLARAETMGHEAVARRLREQVVSEEHSVRMVRSKIVLGVADVGFVYRTDANADGMRIVEPPSGANVRATYGIGFVEPAEVSSSDFLEFVGTDGTEVLRSHGFEVAP